MTPSYKLTQQLMLYCEDKLRNKISELPPKYKNTSVPFEARCDISYDTGYRDGLMTIYKVIENMDVHIISELDEMAERMNQK